MRLSIADVLVAASVLCFSFVSGQQHLKPPKQRPIYKRNISNIIGMLQDFADFDAKFVLDLGANRGDYIEKLKSIFPAAKIFAVEGNADMAVYLQAAVSHYRDNSVSYEIALLGDATGKEVSFYNNEHANTGNSIYREVTKHFKEGNSMVRVERRALETLDDILVRKGFGCPDLIKIDCQGAELDILRGAPRTLRCVQAIVMELSLLRFNKKAPLAGEVISFMDGMGFDIFDITEIHKIRPRGQVEGEKESFLTFQIDALFVRKESRIIDTISDRTLPR